MCNRQRWHKSVKIMVPLKYLSNFCGTLEMPLINYEINLILTRYVNRFRINNPVDNKVPTFEITNTKI